MFLFLSITDYFQSMLFTISVIQLLFNSIRHCVIYSVLNVNSMCKIFQQFISHIFLKLVIFFIFQMQILCGFMLTVRHVDVSWIIICDSYIVMIKCLVNVFNFLYKYIYLFHDYWIKIKIYSRNITSEIKKGIFLLMRLITPAVLRE